MNKKEEKLSTERKLFAPRCGGPSGGGASESVMKKPTVKVGRKTGKKVGGMQRAKWKNRKRGV